MDPLPESGSRWTLSAAQRENVLREFKRLQDQEQPEETLDSDETKLESYKERVDRSAQKTVDGMNNLPADFEVPY
jgi:hypothetical protein